MVPIALGGAQVTLMEMNSLFYLLGGVTGKELCVCDLKTVRVTGGIVGGGLFPPLHDLHSQRK